MTRVTDDGLGFSRRDFVVKGAAAGAALAASSVAGTGSADAMRGSDGKADLALVNGNILTLDAKNTVAGSIAITDGRITAITPHGGHDADEVIDLRGATVIPGLNDSHIHFIRLGIDPGYGVRDIEVAQSINELQQIIADRARTVPAQAFITCIGGWNRAGFKDNRLPTQAELNAAAPRNPVYLAESGGGGAGITNAAAAAFFTAHGVPVNVDGTVSNTTNAKNALVAVQTDDDRLRSTAEAVDHATGLGLTMIQDMGGLVGLSSYAYSLQLWAEKKLISTGAGTTQASTKWRRG
jgi:predicted amidohydrolase YtcJ